jgi:S1-C subfamily serine protease
VEIEKMTREIAFPRVVPKTLQYRDPSALPTSPAPQSTGSGADLPRWRRVRNVLALALALNVPTLARAEHWVIVGSQKQSNVEIYIDVDSVRRDHDLIRYWTKWVYVEPQQSADNTVYDEELANEVGNCQAGEKAIASIVYHYVGNSVGVVTRQRSEWEFFGLAPGSIGEATLRAACRVGAATHRQTQTQPVPPRPAPKSARAEAARSFGSGFVVTSVGLVLTNYHVVEGCSSLQVVGPSMRHGAATVVAVDRRSDLALLRAESSAGSFATFRGVQPVRVGEGVVALGFPLPGLLASDVNVSTGTVSALAGIQDDSAQLQISAPVQPGNSGGPLLDSSALVVGIVVGKLNAIAVAQATGDIPQNINFAIKAEVAKLFLRSHGVEPREQEPGRSLLPSSEVAARGRSFVVQVECTTQAQAK